MPSFKPYDFAKLHEKIFERMKNQGEGKKVNGVTQKKAFWKSQRNEWTCRRQGCTFQHKKRPGSTPYCCEACKNGEDWHTSNCKGYGRRVSKEAAPEGIEDWKKSNCKGYGHRVSSQAAPSGMRRLAGLTAKAPSRAVSMQPPMQGRLTEEEFPMIFAVPINWTCAAQKMGIMQYVEGLLRHFSEPSLNATVLEAWQRTQ